MEKVLVICAHPDDETLGLGGTLALHSLKKDKISILIVADGESSRGKNENISIRQKQAIQACSILGINDIEFLNFPDQRLDSMSLLVLNQEIEKKIKKINPTIIYTHFGGDLNRDHRLVFESVIVSSRPFRGQKIKKILCFETPSSTEWSISDQLFKPNLFVDIQKVLSEKVSALKKYKTEIKKYPHPRSIDAIKNRASYYGSISGLKYAEAFMVFREITRE